MKHKRRSTEGRTGWGHTDGTLGDGRGARGTSSTIEDESSMEGADGTLGAMEDRMDWKN